MIWEFFKMLGSSRVATVKGRVEGKALGYKAKARAKVTRKFNEAIDKPVSAAKNKASKGKGDASKGGVAKAGKASKGKKDGMGFFGRKKDGNSGDSSPDESFSEEAKTAMVDISGLVTEERQDVVGWVVPTSGTQKGQDFRLIDGKNLMGTAADAEVVLTDAYMSSRHATIRHEKGRFMLIDLDSTNGTFANGDRVTKNEIFDNDTIRLGRTDLKFKSLH